jgi:hypothetical protein
LADQRAKCMPGCDRRRARRAARSSPGLCENTLTQCGRRRQCPTDPVQESTGDEPG